jgi:hypothetical protein
MGGGRVAWEPVRRWLGGWSGRGAWMLGGRVGAGRDHRCSGVGSLDRERGGPELDLVTGGKLDRAGDPPAVDEGSVGGAEVLDNHAVVVGEDAGVPPGDARVVDDQVGAPLLAAEDQLAVDRMLVAGPCAFLDDQ